MTSSTHQSSTEYDAIVVGGGHNGLVNGAYLAKAGLRTLILERRHLVGGAAITEELHPGFSFTTFSYALSLLRPGIVQDLDLVKHGFLPIEMPTTFAPTETGDYLESGILKGFIASSGIIGTKVGPMSPGSGLVLLYHSMGEHDGEYGMWGFHKGGNGGLTQVMARAARALGAEIRLESPVERVLTRSGQAVGVVLADGTELQAPVVVSSLDPRRTFLEIVDRRELPGDLVED